MSINYMGIFLYYFVYFYLDQIVYFYFSIITGSSVIAEVVNRDVKIHKSNRKIRK